MTFRKDYNDVQVTRLSHLVPRGRSEQRETYYTEVTNLWEVISNPCGRGGSGHMNDSTGTKAWVYTRWDAVRTQWE